MGWEPDIPARGPGREPPVTLADRAAELRYDLAALDQERGALEDDRAARARPGPSPGPDELADRARGLGDWERAHGEAEPELRAIEGAGGTSGWAGRGPGRPPARPPRSPRGWAEPGAPAGGRRAGGQPGGAPRPRGRLRGAPGRLSAAAAAAGRPGRPQGRRPSPPGGRPGGAGARGPGRARRRPGRARRRAASPPA